MSAAIRHWTTRATNPRRRFQEWGRWGVILGVFILGGLAGVSARASEAPAADVRSTAAVERSGEQTILHVRVEGGVEGSIDRVRDVLLDLESYPDWFPALREWRVLSSEGQSVEVYGQQSLPWPWDPRDYVVRYVWQDLSEGGFRLEAMALGEDAPVAVKKGIVRLVSMRTVWTVKPAGEESVVSYDYDGDPQIRIPDWLATQAWQRHTNEIIRALGREVKRRKAGSGASPN